MKKLLTLLVAGVVLVSISGCKQEELRANPAIIPIGNFKGCDVSYVDRGYRQDSFYIADCETAIATTGETGGKNSTHVANIQNISGLSQEEKDMIERNRSVVRQSALSKLTPEEKTVLGVK